VAKYEPEKSVNGDVLERKVSGTKPDLSRLAELAGGIGLHEHLCLIYDTQEEQFAAALPFLRSGLERGEKCFFVADENNGAAVLNALRKTGTDVDRYVRSGALILTNKPYPKPGPLDPDWLIGFLSRSIQGAGDRKFVGMRTWLGEMTWALVEETAPEALIEFEAKVNNFVRDHHVRALCQYRRQRFPPELILSIIRTHPVVAYGGIICKNPYYVPPEELLKPNQAAQEVERLLNNILTWERSLDLLRALAARVQSVREEESKRIAREIHDELGPALTTLGWDLDGIRSVLSKSESAPHFQVVLDKLEFMGTTVESTLSAVRRIASELRPTILDDFGLDAAIEFHAEQFQARTGIVCSCDWSLPEKDIALTNDQSTAVFRIFQEAMTNILRHARATKVEITAKQEGTEFVLTITDNGRGMSDAELSNQQSLGLAGMRERAHLIGGMVEIKRAEGMGTMVAVRVPSSTFAIPPESVRKDL
jgi:signal transduction histidine kinase